MLGRGWLGSFALCVASTALGALGCAEEGQWILVPPDGWDVPADDGGTGEAADDGSADDVAPADDGSTVDTPPVDGEGDVACGTGDFSANETQEAYTAPVGARYMYIKAWGAGGNGEGMSAGCSLVDNGGMGGYTEAVYELLTTPPPFIVIVGGEGHAGAAGTMFFGWGQDGGGGLSGVFVGPDEITPTDQAKALVIAGGGGGVWPGCVAGGCGNDDDAGGQSTMLGGRSTSGDELGVNGGAGGYNGGTGGDRNEAGMGGTGFVDEDRPGMRLVRHRILAATPGSAVVPNNADPDYLAAGYPAAMSETDGWVVIHFTCEEPPLI
jgi:hypothetical protein